MPKKILPTYEDKDDWDLSFHDQKPPTGWSERLDEPGGDIDKCDLPLRFKEFRKPKTKADFIVGKSSRTRFVSNKFKDIVEHYESGVHKFYPLKIDLLDGGVSEGEYYLFKVGNIVEAINPEVSEVKEWYSPNGNWVGYSSSTNSKLFFCRNKLNNIVLWHDKNLPRSEFFCTDEFANALYENKISVTQIPVYYDI